VGATVQAQRTADRGRASVEKPQPQPVAQDDDRLALAIRPDVRRLEGAADHGWNAEEIEGVTGQQHAAEALRCEFPGQQHGFHGRCHDVRERRQLRQSRQLVEGVGAAAAPIARVD